MAEVKTYKCDICGKIHYDESCEKNDRIVIEHWGDDEKSTDIYNNICTGCIHKIYEVIKEPDIFEDIEDKLRTKTMFVEQLESIIKSMRDAVCGWDSWEIYTDCNSRYEYMRNMGSAIMTKCDEMRESEQRWKAAAILLGTWGLMAFILLWFI